jgi:thioesterase domain-containing protein
MTFSGQARGSIEICVVHDVGEAGDANSLAEILRDLGTASVLSAQPGDVGPPLLKSIQGLGARLAMTNFQMKGSGRLVVVGLGRVGEASARGLVAFLLGQDIAVEALYSVHIPSEHDVDSSIRRIFSHIDFDVPRPCWSDMEDRARIKRVEAPSLLDAGQRLRAELQASGDQQRARAGAPLVLPLRPGGGGEAEIFCIPGAGASVISFLDLAQLAPHRFGVTGLQPRGLDGCDPPYTSVQAAARALERIVSARPSSSAVHLVGHSYGGCIAFQLAQYLSDGGENVASLTLIDSRPPRDSRWPVDLDDAEVALGWLRMSEQAAQRPLGVEKEQLRSHDPSHNLKLVQEAMTRAGLLPPRTMRDALVGPMRMFSACVRNWFHTESVYSGPMRLIYLDDPRMDDAGNAETARHVRESWSDHAPQLSLCRGPGNHITGLKNPHARDLIKLMGWEPLEARA